MMVIKVNNYDFCTSYSKSDDNGRWTECKSQWSALSVKLGTIISINKQTQELSSYRRMSQGGRAAVHEEAAQVVVSII